jgi:SAM-dependent methyltransferase
MIEKMKNFLRKLKRRFTKPDHKQIFADVYKNRKWGTDHKSEFYSGTGSDEEHSYQYIQAVSDFIKNHSITTVVDLGCGDFRIGKRLTELNKINYTGVDVVEDLINYNNKNYKGGTIRFLHRNIVRDTLPDGELCLIRQVLQHLSNRDIKTILRKCKKYQYLIVTEHLPITLSNEPNIDKQPGAGIRYFSGSGVYLDKPPYNKTVRELVSVFPEDHPDSKIVTYQIIV